MPFDARKVAAALLSKGFRKDQSHHTYYHLYVDGKDVGVFTKISQGEKEIGTPLAKRMQRQMKLSSSTNFQDFVQCPLTYEVYIDMLRKAGVID